MSKNEFIPVLASFGFSLKTKAFNSILSNPKSDYEKYVKVLSTVLTKDEAEVYGVILFNSHLNGSYVNWGFNSNSVPHRIGKAERILFSGLSQADREVLIKGLIDVIQVKTFRRWALALKAVKNKQEWIKSQALLFELATKAEADGLRLKSVESQALSTEPKELTLKEIESLLGFKVKIIS
jgi:hypothetical protein